jgi:hypothetical protein
MIAKSGDIDQASRFTFRTGVGRCLASLDCYHPEAVDLWSARLGNGLATPQWTTLGLQKVRRVF